MNWYYAQDGKQIGPVDETEFSRLVGQGSVQPNTLVWREGMAEWQPYAAVAATVTSAPGAPAAGPTESIPATGVVCVECGGTFRPDEVMQYGNSAVCANCKPVFLQKLREGALSGSISGLRYAGFWIRFAAKMIDGIILAVVLIVPMVLVGFSVGFGRDSTSVLLFQAVIQFGALIANAIYTGIFLGKYGATPGKMLCGLKVLTAEMEPISYGRSFGRYFAEILSGLICYIGYIIAAFDDQKRSLHDRICNTRVVHK